MKRVLEFFSVIAVLLIVPGIAFADEHMGEHMGEHPVLMASLAGMAALWADLYHSGNIDQFPYADNVISYPAAGEPIVGRDNVIPYIQGVYNAGIRFPKIMEDPPPDAVGLIGLDGAWGKWSGPTVNAEGNVLGYGGSLWIYRRTSEGWLPMYVHSYNLPPPAASE